MSEEKSPLTEAYEKSSEAYHNGTSLWKILAVCSGIVVLIILLTFVVFLESGKDQNEWTVDALTQYNPPSQIEKINLDQYSFKITEDIYSRSAILINYTTGHIVCEKNANAELFPASVTKAMTVLVALENVADPNLSVAVSGQSFARLTEQNASVAGLSAGQQVTIMDLCYATILPSGADAAVTLAEYVSGSEEAFVTLMNAKALELGMDGTHFCNVTGLHDDEHYTTAYDMAIMLQYALRNENFYRVFTTEEYTIPPDSVMPQGLRVYSSVFEKANLMYQNKLNTGKLLGGKSGYTPEAGLCLATLCRVGDNEYITVTLCADGTLYTPQYALIDTYQIINSYAY